MEFNEFREKVKEALPDFIQRKGERSSAGLPHGRSQKR